MQSSFWDEDDVDASPVEAFGNLAQSLTEEVRFSGRGRVAEIVEQRGGVVRSHRALRPGQHAAFPAAGVEVTHRVAGAVHIRGAWHCMGTVKRGDGTVQLCETLQPAQDLVLNQGDVATLHFAGGFLLVRPIAAPASLAEVMRGAFKRSFRGHNLRGLLLSALWLSVVTHLVVLLGAWLWELRSPSIRASEVETGDDWHEPDCFGPHPETPPVVEVDVLKLGGTAAPPRTAAPTTPQLRQGTPVEASTRRSLHVVEGAPSREQSTFSAIAVLSATGKTPAASNQPRGTGARLRTAQWEQPRRAGEYGDGTVSCAGAGRGTKCGSGTLDRPRPGRPAAFAAIAKVVDSHVAEVRRCYDAALLRGSNRAGQLRMEVSIAANGRVTRTRLVSSALDQASNNCIRRSVSRWRFPSTTGPLVVVLPFLFQHNVRF